ncbi:MAG TPA: hypothetical protein VNX23_10385 [Bradyrhizobium sp.]|jgi:hypothetical protein|uniref:hypothetical protein n=1 Tax=Bradyrhizobium sp. TaxID=376 RepID=UPI002B614357|nr:hypothetical protein [Bradyrhizobium sp.]HXB77796.1 hypothetical protein [Bradyrhizobium sp.]
MSDDHRPWSRSSAQGEYYEIEDLWRDLWINAINALASRAAGYAQAPNPQEIVSDPGPLVQLLRSDTPMPSSVRHALADLLVPEDPASWDFMLVPKRVVKFDRMIGPELDAVHCYAKLMDAGAESSESAAEEAGKNHLVDGRTINRYRAKLKRLGERLRGSH